MFEGLLESSSVNTKVNVCNHEDPKVLTRQWNLKLEAGIMFQAGWWLYLYARDSFDFKECYKKKAIVLSKEMATMLFVSFYFSFFLFLCFFSLLPFVLSARF